MPHLKPTSAVCRYVSYLRVSTDKQGERGLGIEAQRQTVAAFMASQGEAATLLAEYVEVESGKRDDRPQLAAAIEQAQLSGAALVIAKLDRLSRDAHFLLGLEKAGVEFHACDLPKANRLTLTIMAAVAEHEREMISQRTKAALKAARSRGVRLGNPNGARALRRASRGNTAALSKIKANADKAAAKLSPALAALKAQGILSANAIAKALNARGVLTSRGSTWDAKAVIRLGQRLEANASVRP